MAWSARSTGGSAMPGRPAPRMIGATITCSRSRQPAARKRDTVSAPPSTSMRRSPASAERCKDGRGRKLPIGGGQPNKLNARDRSSGLSFCGYKNATDTVLAEDPRLVAEPAVWVDDDAGRLLPGDPAYGQLRIVGYRSTDADNDRIDQSPQPVEVGQSGRPIDVF